MFKIRDIVWSKVKNFLSEDMFLTIMTVMGFYEYFSCQFYIAINHLLWALLHPLHSSTADHSTYGCG